MASSAIRKSGRIKTRKKLHFQDDDYEYDKADFNSNISENISNFLNSHSTDKDDGKLLQYQESFPNVSKRLCGKEEVQSDRSSGKDSEKDRNAFAEENDIVIANLDITQSFHSKSRSSQFTPEINTLEHQGKNKSTKSYACDQCDKNFSDLAAFKRHLRWHTGERPFKCDQCEKSFTESCSLKRHMKIHEDERPFTCDICFKSFRDPTSFSRHQLTHVERPRSFQCSYCEKNFTDKSGLKRHERTHSGLRPYECSICHKTFSESGSFRRHQKIHIGVRNHHCPRCKRSFMEKQSLIRHQKTVCGFWESQYLSDTSQPNEANTTSETNTKFPTEDNYVISNSDSKATKIKDFASVSSSGPSSVSSQHESSSLSALENLQTKKSSESQKCSPSLSSLIQKDPNLYDSISEIVDSIDSYEKMLDLCGDRGQKEIEKALTREPSPMPENLMCFECGEQLLDGENFKSEGKSFNSKSYNSFKCLNCEDDEEKYGEPPVLTAEFCEEGQAEQIKPLSNDEELAGTGNKSGDCEYYQTSSAFHAQEPMENYNEHVNIQEKMHFNGSVSSDTDDDVESKHVRETMVYSAATSRSPSGHPKPQDENFQTVYPIKVEDKTCGHQAIPSLICIEDIKANHTPQSSLDKVPNVEYEADDPNIPSVFPCHLCTKVFATSAFLEKHLELHKKSPHKCMVCGKTFSGNPALKRHMRVHTGEKPYSCPLCTKKFRDPSNFGKHKKFCSSVNGFVPSPVSSTSSAISGTSTLSIEENLDDTNKNNEDDLKLEVDKTLPPLMPNDKHSTVIYNIKEEISDDLATPFMAVVPSLDDFEEHTQENDVNCEQEKQINYIPCEICQKLCENEQHLEMHMNYHKGNPDVTCIECGKTFSDCHGLKRHMHIHAQSRPFTCDYCNRGYCDNWSLKKHKSRGCMNSELQVPVDFLHPCQHCSRVFSEADLLEDHMKCHKGKLGFECDICSKRFSEAFNLKRHRRLHMAICSSCGMEFKDIKEMAKHQQNDCSLSLPTKQEGSSTNNFPCQDCGRTYSTLAYLERHRKFHSDLKPYACQICNKKFAEAFKLRRHEKAHTEDKPFVCQECGRGYADEAHLKRHVINSSCTVSKTTRGAVNFPCQYCDKVFTKNYMLVRHMNVHSQERPFSCNICGRSYKDTSSLKRHQLIHEGNKDFICSVCGKAFFYADSLKRHMSGRCGKSLISRKYKSANVKRQINFKSKIQDNVNNNNKNYSNDNICDFSLSNNGEIKYEYMKTESTALENRLHTMPYRSRYSKDFIKGSMIDQHKNKSVKVGPWSCRNKKHCWRCDVKMPSIRDLLSHIRIHRHKKKFPCLHCYARFTCKAYWKVHQSLCTKLSGTKKLLISPSPNLLDMSKKGMRRPRRSVPRAQWSWLTQI